MPALRAAVVFCLVLVLAVPSVLAAGEPAPAQLRGVLLDSQGLPAKGYQIGLRTANGDLFTSGATAADGTFAVTGLPADTYRIVAFAPDGTEFPVLSKEVKLTTGQVERVEIRMAEKGTAPGRPASAADAAKGGTAAKAGLWSSTAFKVGIVVAGALAVGAAVSGGSSKSSTPVSPSAP